MDDAESCIAIPDRPRNDPDCQKIVHLLKGYLLPPDLLMHTINSLNSRLNRARDIVLLEFLVDEFLDLFKKLLPDLSSALDSLTDFPISLRLKVAEGKVF